MKGHNYHPQCQPAHVANIIEPAVVAALRATGVSKDAFKRTCTGRFNRIDRDVKNREVVMAWLRANTYMSLPEIARAIGGTTHTTVIAALKRYARRVES